MRLVEALKLFVGEFPNKNTQRAYRAILKQLVDTIGPFRPAENVSNVDLHTYVQDLKSSEIQYIKHPQRPNLAKPLSAATVNNHVRVIKHFFAWLVEMEVLEKSPAASLKSPRQTRRGDRNKAATPEEIEVMLRAAFGNPKSYALCMFLVDTGARAGGAAGLKIADLDFDNLRAVVTEKRQKTRLVWFSNETCEALKIWLLKRPIYDHDYVFGNKGGALTSQSISQTVRRAAIKAGIRSLGSHSLRHAKGYELASLVDVSTAALALGHEDPSTTLWHYYPVNLKLAEDAIRATHKPEQTDLKVVRLRKT